VDLSPPNTSPFDGGPNTVDPTSPPGGCRDWFVLEAIAAALEATQQFDAVTLSVLPEVEGRGASQTKLAAVLPVDWQEVDESGDPDDVQDTVRLSFALVILVRDGDAVTRDREGRPAPGRLQERDRRGRPDPRADDPGWTKLRRGKWQDAVAPERRMVVTGESATGSTATTPARPEE